MGVNCFLIQSNNKIILIDAPSGIEAVTNYLDEHNLKLDYVLVTHIHFDHILGANHLYKNGYIDEFYVSPKEMDLFLDNSEKGNLGGKYGLELNFNGKVSNLEDLDAKALDLEIAYIEGHSMQSAVYIFNKDKTIFSGDTLFHGAIGRSDFPYGDYNKLRDGINEKIMIKEDYKVYPGHGFMTTTTAEKGNHLLGKGE